MWAFHLKLQSMLRINKRIDMESFVEEKVISKKHVAKEAYVFNEGDLQKFSIDASDITYLFFKVIDICSILG